MTPAERQLVTELFDRLATLEDAPRDPDAERAIRGGLAQAPNAVYALVQTTLVQDEALKGANARIEELEAELARINPPPRQGGFLDNMRGSIWGRQEQRGSVPNVRPGEAPMGVPPAFGGPQMGGSQMGGPQGGQAYGGPGYGPQGQMQPPPEPARGGGSFLGTAAAAAAGAIGGAMLMNSMRGMTGGSHSGGGHALADTGHGGGGSPWGSSGGGGGELARQAGVDDIGRSSGSGPFGQSQGMLNEGGSGKGGDADTFGNSPVEDENFDDDDAGFDDGGDLDSGEE